MSNFTENINKYMSHYKIKKNFLAKMTNIEKNKLSRLLNEKQQIQLDDMEIIANALGKDIQYFMQNSLELVNPEYNDEVQIAFYMGEVDEGKKDLAAHSFNFLEAVDTILGYDKKINENMLEGFSDGV